MDKGTLIGLGLVGLPFAVVGAVVGGLVVNKMNEKYKYYEVDMWKGTAEFLREQLFKEYDRNDELKKELKSRKA